MNLPILRLMMFGLCLLVSMAAPAVAHGAPSVEAPGKVFYKMPSGEITQREMSLVVPARGEGQVILKWASGELAAESFSSRKQSGRTIFYVRFTKVPFAPEGTIMVFKGTYDRGSNLAIYYGDIFVANDQKKEDEWKYSGGFYFKANVR